MLFLSRAPVKLEIKAYFPASYQNLEQLYRKPFFVLVHLPNQFTICNLKLRVLTLLTEFHTLFFMLVVRN